jgi:uncharacterized membrane protein YfcA
MPGWFASGLFMVDHLILFIVSWVANTLSALAGGGSGLLQLPALLFMGLPFATALATHKIASVMLGVGATLRHTKEAPLNLRFAGFILVWGLPGVVLGAHSILQVPDQWAKLALGAVTIGVGIYSLCQAQLGQSAQPKNRAGLRLWLGGAVIFAMGFINGSLTSGSGLLVTLWLVRWFGFDYKQAVTYTLILVGFFWNGSGAITLALRAPVQWDWLPALLLGSFAGGYLGAHLSIIKGNLFIKRMFETMTLLVGAKLVFDNIHAVL